MKTVLRMLLALSVFALVAESTYAQTFERGDIFVGSLSAVFGGFPPLNRRTRLLWLDSSGNLKATLESGEDMFYVGMAFDRDGVLHVASYPSIKRFTAAGLVDTYPPEQARPFWLSFNSNGTLYATGGGLTHRAYEYAPDKTRTLAFDLGKDADGSDLAADQCTLMFASGKTIQRYDICRSVLLAPLTATLTEFGTALRIAPDGSVLVAQLGSGEVPPIIARIRADGTTMMTYPGATRVIALDPDKRSFWRADGPALYKVDLATGVILRGPINLPADNEGVTGLAIFGEPRAATSEGLPAEAIPTLSTWTLLAFGMALTAVASLRAR